MQHSDQQLPFNIIATALVFGFLLLTATEVSAQPEYLAEAAPQTINDLFADIGKAVPAFGGMFVDESKDTLYVYMAPGERGDAASVGQAISSIFGDSRPPQHRLALLPGRYSFVQLKQWLDLMTAQMLDIPGVISVGIDNSTNRLRIA